MIEKFDFLEVDKRGASLVNKVYFTCHSEDFGRFYQRIADDVFVYSEGNCSIYRKKLHDMEIPRDELDFLSEMTLVVVPVTRKLLRDKRDNHAIAEIEHAIKCGVTVLPFMMEPRLDKFYESSVFGKRQWVSPDFAGRDAVPYGEKLKKFFEEHFLGDSTVREIKDEFSSRIFLSYRKKDRSLAKPLMKEIHRGEGMEDVAIWYDEYLPLAEDYAHSIEEQMNASDAVAFLVTDSLTEEGNYVKTVEYPMAKEKEGEKVILPLEPHGDEGVRARVRADFETVRQGFPDYVELSDLATKLNQKHKENTPHHKYLLALAYLNGVDVEKDVDRAVKLLTEAADESYIPAAEKLRGMYSSGEGVEIDYSKACEWSERVYRLYVESPEYGADHPETKLALATRALDYGALGRSKKVNYGTYFTHISPDGAVALKKSVRIFHEVLDSMRDMDGVNPKDLVCVVASLAGAYEEEGKLHDALRYYAESLVLLYETIRSDVVAHCGDSRGLPEARFELREDGNYDADITEILARIEKLYAVVESANMPYDYSDDIVHVMAVARVYYTKRDYKMAIVSGECAKRLAEKTDNKQLLFIAQNMLGSAYRADKQYAKAKTSLTAAHKLALGIFGNEKHPLVLNVLLTLGYTYWSALQFDDAEKCLKNVLKLISQDAEAALSLPIDAYTLESDIRMIDSERTRTRIMSSKAFKDYEASRTNNRYGKFKL